jgi:EAL domain-containing protein (putative c-di-GMP-specific phosphodiesterase class I)/CheY-like chemotaxis protein
VNENTDARILVLDDDPCMLRLFGLMLGNLGFTKVTSCTNGRAALQAIDDRGTVPSLILLDLNMPEMDGVRFVRHLVERQYGGSLILVSGENERMLRTVESLVRANQITVLGRLHKPPVPEALAALLRQWAPNAPVTPAVTRAVYSAGDVRAAITRGELVNHYQPKVLVSTGQVKGVEALVRWQHPVDGIVYPDQFIGVAEENGLIHDLTAVVLRTALIQAKLWRDMGFALRMSINVSMDDLAWLDFTEFVAAQAAAAGVPPEDVVLEVTESRFQKDLQNPLEVLARLRLKRFSLSIDDFGTGHSSLAQLRNFPFDELKVDRSFVHGAGADETLRAILGASVGLAKQLGMDTVAEGVEDRADWDFLSRIGCGMAQGYFIARPMLAEALPSWIRAWGVRVQAELQAAA